MFATITLNPAIDHSISLDRPLTLGGVHCSCGEAITPGGKGINVAKALAAAGARVIAGGLLGRDNADVFTRFLDSEGIAHRFFPVDGSTRTNLMLSGGNGTEIKCNRPGFPDLIYDRDAIGRYTMELSSAADVVVLSGSLPARFPAAAWADIADLLRTTGKRVVFDGSGAALSLAGAQRLAVVKPNESEAGALCGFQPKTDSEFASAALALSRKHGCAIISLGKRGCLFARDGEVFFAKPAPVKALDSTGSGDAMLGFFCAHYFPAMRLTGEAIAMAVAAGAAAAEEKGTPPIRLARVNALAEAAIGGIRKLSFPLPPDVTFC